MKKVIFLFLLAILSCKNDVKTLETKPTESESVVIRDTIYIETHDQKPNKTQKQLKEELTQKGYQAFDFVDEQTKDTILMQQYFIAFLKSGPIRSQNEEEATRLQEEHIEHLTRMYREGYADISGPFGDNSEIRGITIYNVPTLEMADSLANLDPMVKAKRLVVEVRPWWAAKGYKLR